MKNKIIIIVGVIVVIGCLVLLGINLFGLGDEVEKASEAGQKANEKWKESIGSTTTTKAASTGRKIVCTDEAESDGIKRVQNITLYYDKNGALESMSATLTADYSKSTNVNLTEADLKKECDEYNESSDMTCKIENKKITITQNTSDPILLSTYDFSYDEIKTKIENNDNSITAYLGKCVTK